MVDLSKPAALAAAVVLVAAVLPAASPDPPAVTVHEWGTFTSIAGEDGHAVPWRPLTGPPDLPGFVQRTAGCAKGILTATVRMETPVLYFYAANEAVLDVTVRFRQGLITEYFPRGIVRPACSTSLATPGFAHAIDWRGVRIQPGVAAAFPAEDAPSHYYAARDTDAAPLRVGPDRERFLFYRGVGSFALPLTAVVAPDGGIVLANTGSEKIAAVVLFQNRGGRIGWRVHRGLTGRARVARPAPGGDVASLRAELVRTLTREGLYEKEAAAMVETWSDTWFEEGTRVFYLLPQPAVDAVLPLTIRPAAERIVRVFVGRLELVTSATLTDLEDALRTHDRVRLARFGRFLRPFADRLFAALPAADRARLEAIVEDVPLDTNSSSR